MIDILDQKIDKETQKSHNLRQTILRKAFSGSLVPQDENGEPTNVIQERVSAENKLDALSRKKTKQRQKVLA